MSDLKHAPLRAVAFDCYGTLLRINTPTNPWHRLLAVARSHPDARSLDPRREPIPTIESFASACGVEFRQEWRQDLDIELASIEVMPDASMVLTRLREAGFRIALASNLAPAYVEPALRLLGEHVDVTCFSCDPDVQVVKPERAFFAALRARLDLPACEILMVGDSLTSDIEGALAFGMSALHVVPGNGPPRRGQIGRLTEVLSFLDLK